MGQGHQGGRHQRGLTHVAELVASELDKWAPPIEASGASPE
jgi:hypothetical protein